MIIKFKTPEEFDAYMAEVKQSGRTIQISYDDYGKIQVEDFSYNPNKCLYGSTPYTPQIMTNDEKKYRKLLKLQKELFFVRNLLRSDMEAKADGIIKNIYVNNIATIEETIELLNSVIVKFKQKSDEANK